MIFALTNTASGVAGEAAVTAALLRAGLQVAKPYWNDDEMDLLIFWKDGRDFIPIPVQVKSVQSTSVTKSGKVRIIFDAVPEGVRKRYVDRQPSLCLAIYSPAQNKIWFIPGANNIKEVYATWLKTRSKKGRKSPTYATMKPDQDVPIHVNVSKVGDADFDGKWLFDTVSPDKLRNQIQALAQAIKASGKQEAVMASAFTMSSDESSQSIYDADVEVSTSDEADALLKNVR